MKKIIIVLLILTVLYIGSSDSNIVIPKEAIRFRVIANSNNKKDQANKKIISNKLSYNISNLLKDSNTIDESRMLLKNNIKSFKDNIDKTLKENKIDTDYEINYGDNYFPEKEYKGVKYKEGYYESLVVTLGKGMGENFWCVLFPPLCLIEEDDTTEYKSFVKEIIDKYF